MWGKIIDFEADCKDAQEVENEMLIVSILLFLKKNKKIDGHGSCKVQIESREAKSRGR